MLHTAYIWVVEQPIDTTKPWEVVFVLNSDRAMKGRLEGSLPKPSYDSNRGGRWPCPGVVSAATYSSLLKALKKATRNTAFHNISSNDPFNSSVIFTSSLYVIDLH